MTNPTVSIISPCYNQEKYLADTIDSVLAQTYQNWEMIIVDDGSTDDSATIAQSYANKDNRIKYFYQRNAGPSAARNKGVCKSKGKYLFFLDGDDIIDPIYLRIGVEHMENDASCACFFTAVQYFGGKSGIANVQYSGYKKQLCESSLWCCGFMRRCDFIDVGGFDEKMKGFEDWEFYIRFLYQRGNVFVDPRPLFKYRIANKNSVGTIANKRFKEITSYIYSKHKEKYEEYYGTPFTAYRESWYYHSELDKILSSRAYRLGMALLKPFKILKSILSK